MKVISTRQFLITLIPASFILFVMGMVGFLFHVEIPMFTRDVTAIARIHPLAGILSQLGMLMWCAAAVVCAFAAITLRNVQPSNTFWFLLSSALLTAYLLFDDIFLFHEALAFKIFGVDEVVVYAVLGISVAAYLIGFRRTILQTNFGALVLALGFLSMSVALDSFLEPLLMPLGHWKAMFEDGAKWLGIAFWCSYYVETSHQFFMRALSQVNAPATDVFTPHV
jgi:hypothetical protein